MQLADEYRLSEYQDLGPLDDNDRIRLKRNQINGNICVEKHVSPERKPVYEFLSKHPSKFIPQIYECICKEQELLIIEEYITGKTLEQILMERSMDEYEASQIIIGLCQALKPLHRADPPVICRDLKAENIMLDTQGNLKIIDFDIARIFQPGKARDTILLGTTEYAAPEQFGYLQTDNRTDIYALGVLLNYLVLKKFPVEQTISGPLETIVKKCTCMDPAQRYQDVETLESALSKFFPRQHPGQLTLSHEKKRTPKRSWLPPGFRTGNILKMLAAIVGYGFLTWVCFSMSLTTTGGLLLHGPILRFEQLIIWLSQIGWIFVLFNYRECRTKLPLVRNCRLTVRIIGYCLTEIIFISLAVLICVISESFFL